MLRKETVLILFVLSLLVSYFPLFNIFLKLIIYILIIFILVGLKKQNLVTILVTIITGFFFGLLLNLTITYQEKKSYTGLEVEKIHFFSMKLIDDSFLSSNGNLIYKGKLRTVWGKESISCSSSGKVLVIGKRNNECFYQGEILKFETQLNLMEESKEFAYIAFSTKEPERFSWGPGIYGLRRKIRIKVENQMDMLSNGVSSLFKALLIGNSDSLDNQLKESFRNSGVMHLLALSGFHVAIVVLCFTVLLKPLVGKRNAFFLTIPSIVLYLFIAGAGPSLLRAVIMYFTAGFLYCIDKYRTILYTLLLTIVIQLMISPVQGYSLSFQLSYLALGGIIIGGKVIDFRLKPWLPTFLRLPLAASIAAQIATTPILIYHFKEIFPIGIISSLFLTPLITLFMWVAIISLVCSIFLHGTFVFNILSFLCDKIYNVIVLCSKWFSSTGKISFSSNSEIFFYLSIMMIAVIFLYIDFWRLNERRKGFKFKLRFTGRD